MKLPIILRGPCRRRFGRNRPRARLQCQWLFFLDTSAGGKCCRTVPATIAGAGRYRSGTTPGAAVVLRFRALSGHGE